ncbi:hypothetical protein HDV05_006591, partial [Chytridiales sp. JEL 0842]
NFDLLDGKTPSDNQKDNAKDKAKSYRFREDKNGNPYLEYLQEVRVKDLKTARDIIGRAMAFRSVKETNVNSRSSRGHLITTIKLVKLLPGGPETKPIVSRLAVADLAGSENGKQTNTEGLRSKEAVNILKSLFSLSNCITAMIEKHATIPFRGSQLTHALQSYFRRGLVTFLLHISPTNEEQTKFVLEKSRQMCQLVTYHPVKKRKIEHKEENDTFETAKLKQERDRANSQSRELSKQLDSKNQELDSAHTRIQELESLEERLKAENRMLYDHLRQALEHNNSEEKRRSEESVALLQDCEKRMREAKEKDEKEAEERMARKLSMFARIPSPRLTDLEEEVAKKDETIEELLAELDARDEEIASLEDLLAENAEKEQSFDSRTTKCSPNTIEVATQTPAVAAMTITTQTASLSHVDQATQTLQQSTTPAPTACVSAAIQTDSRETKVIEVQTNLQPIKVDAYTTARPLPKRILSFSAVNETDIKPIEIERTSVALSPIDFGDAVHEMTGVDVGTLTTPPRRPKLHFSETNMLEIQKPVSVEQVDVATLTTSSRKPSLEISKVVMVQVAPERSTVITSPPDLSNKGGSEALSGPQVSKPLHPNVDFVESLTENLNMDFEMMIDPPRDIIHDIQPPLVASTASAPTKAPSKKVSRRAKALIESLAPAAAPTAPPPLNHLRNPLGPLGNAPEPINKPCGICKEVQTSEDAYAMHLLSVHNKGLRDAMKVVNAPSENVLAENQELGGDVEVEVVRKKRKLRGQKSFMPVEDSPVKAAAPTSRGRNRR